ncbi:acetyl/propionyl/methylcrotonyl-CoA carboxylase subunit alpha [Aquabacterium sp. CECT 9606]|uniref:acetyl/propionyl/methylcrotonyl-CoA carboxylase subunit alpha n=1 Tax=Aquabacterium sp. CECT 9606 TaxID=2845822 RepID=UPI001E3E7207|nr:acetyl/propionyl/methylcrotonyl-CoA carboxylase subunit alpha [Aquabacterium sp. CECT 9606]CAH0348423.1 Acetyl-/propionyl-coenzyme A carboxylase alpha chain [Aquabacterium sp. CECT 9606]
MFNKILIANRGEIACRVAATARRLGVRTVAVYSDADANAAHVHACDEAVRIGPASPRESYLLGERILAAAQATGAQAIHPGYGFLSENAGFAKACVDAGLVFIGPPASSIAAMGSKSAAKALMESAGVPLVPGYHGDCQESTFLQAEADFIGYPVLIKASAGGGGKGMRTVQRSEDFSAALASCQREATASFGDDRVLVERYVTRPRHIEIQVFGDSHGNYVHLFERDCSVQRRHQKVLEEAPAPGMSPERRAEMGAAAIAAARSVGYVGAGTVEFIVEQGGSFYFMEMNTRLQVEHPVTEAITGLDLVEWQLRVASGEPLPLTQDQLAIKGHAIEARICAENPLQQFLPATGPLRTYRLPTSSSFSASPVRVDSGVREGDEISPHYDSMIAKLIVWGPTRDQALARLDAALGDLHISGLHTNVAFVQRIIRTLSFQQADLDTALIEREQAALFSPTPLAPLLAVAGLAARLLNDEASSVTADPWSQRDGWRLHGAARRAWPLMLDGSPITAWLTCQCGGPYLLQCGELHASFEAKALAPDRFDVTLAGQRLTLAVYRDRDHFEVFAPYGQAKVNLIDPLAQASTAHAGGRLTALMPGRVVALLVKVGDTVKAGDALAVTEAMKMEHTMTAPRDGVVSELLCAPGDQVPEGAELLRLAEKP